MKTLHHTFGPLAGQDALGRRLPMAGRVGPLRADRYVGMFYFVNLRWQGRALGDNTRIWQEQPEAFQDPDHPIWESGGFYWGQPLFGYYAHDDAWVIRRHVMMLIQADIDFIAFDTTNLTMHAEVTERVLSVLSEFNQAGWQAPKAIYYTNSQPGKRVREIYDTIYKPGKYPDTWFMQEGKPLIIGRPEFCDEETRDFFTFRQSQWPTEPLRQVGSFPWMSFPRPQLPSLTPEGAPETISVSVAQHPQIRFGDSAFHGEGGNRGRSYHAAFHKADNDYLPGAIQYGYNIAEQWERAIETDPRMVFVTGWNEWVAGVIKSPGTDRPVTFVDAASQEFSRDLEPMRGGHFDNYFMQLIDYVRRYKGAPEAPEVSGPVTIDLDGGFDPWQAVTPDYRGFPFFDIPRDHMGMDGKHYTTSGNCNVFDSMKMARDEKHLYVYAQCAQDIVGYDFTNRMQLLLRVHRGTEGYDAGEEPAWEGYHYLLNHERMDGDVTFLHRCLGGWRWKPAAAVQLRQQGNRVQAAIPLDSLGLAGVKHFEIHFKWTDRLEETETVEDFYLNGCTAPYGRLNFVYRV